MKTNSLDFDAQALREKILDLAMRGKLVPQDPNDEPASVLLDKIKAEKAELIKEKKIKKTKSLPPITDDEKPFDIPDSWEWVRLGDVINLVSGRDIPKKYHLSSKSLNSVPYITGASNINEDGQITISEWIKDPSVLVKRGTLLLSVKGTVGKIAKLEIPEAHIARQIMGIENVYNLDLDFQKYFLESYIEKLKKKAKSMIPGVSREDILLANIPVPPLLEQSRIAAKIAQLFALLRKVETSTQQYAKLQTLLKSKVLDLAMRGKLVKQDPNDEPASELLKKIKAEKAELIKEKKIKESKPLPPITDEEKPFDIPDSWEWIRLGDLTAPVEYAMADGPFGSNLKKTDYTLDPEVRIIQLSNIGENGWKDQNVKYTTFEHLKSIQRSEVFPGNIVIAKMMPAGRAIIVPNKDKKYVLSSDAVKFIPDTHIYKDFLIYAINSNTYRDQVNEKLQGTTRPRTSLKKLKNFLIPLPPFDEQKRIVTKTFDLFNMIG